LGTQVVKELLEELGQCKKDSHVENKVRWMTKEDYYIDFLTKILKCKI
jgi:hypothetical protein